MDGKYYFKKGQYAFAIGDYQKCFKMFSKALEKGYEQVKTLLSRGAAYLIDRDYFQALQDFNRVLEIDGNNERAYYYRGITRLNIGEYWHATKDLDNALSLNPKRGAAFFARGIAWTRLDREDRAVADFQQAVAHSHIETEKFLNIFGSDPQGLQRSEAFLQSKRTPLTSAFSEVEIEKLRRWMKTITAST